MQIRVCRYKNVGVAGYAEAFMPVQSDFQTSEWYSYFENDVLDGCIYTKRRLYRDFSSRHSRLFISTLFTPASLPQNSTSQ